MKKFLISALCVGTLFFSGCSLNLSNFDIQKLSQKAAEYMQTGDFEKAASRLEAVVELNPDLPEVYFNLGIAYYKMEELEKAAKAYSDALLRKPDLADAYYSRAIVYEDMAYNIINTGESDKNPAKTQQDKIALTEFLQNAKSDYENYIKFQKDATDVKEVQDKIIQIENKLTAKNNEG